ncbi:P-type conjugative transfer protein VirB9 [Luteibacter sp.]|uniref:P-type conjugative transfer protein VirB9 n=1 Tax=Luteibacter sp. TaxID=1886636 RepID=UPI002F41C451
MRLHIWGLIALSMVAGVACAESRPKDGRYDARIKDVLYNAADVVKVVGHYGYSTDIQFAPGETTENIALGDSVAWEVAPAANHLFVKPSEDNAVTNMTVVTNKRVYQLSLDARNTHGPSSGKSHDMYFQVRYVYPEDDGHGAAQASKRQVQQAFAKPPLARNWNYYGCGGRDMQPSEIFDDGRFTYMRFPAAQEIPAVFIMDHDGSESIVNGSMHDDYYVVQRTASRFVLRRGKFVACIQNRGFDDHGVASPTNTTSPEVKRTIKAGSADAPADIPAAPSTIPTTQSNGAGAKGQPLPPPPGASGWPLPHDKKATGAPTR